MFGILAVTDPLALFDEWACMLISAYFLARSYGVFAARARQSEPTADDRERLWLQDRVRLTLWAALIISAGLLFRHLFPGI